MKSNQQYAPVTGGTSGIGYELTTLLKHDGFNLIMYRKRSVNHK